MASQPKTAKSKPETVLDEEQIRRKAHELWLERGDKPGSPEEDWAQAEQELRQECSGSTDDE